MCLGVGGTGGVPGKLKALDPCPFFRIQLPAQDPVPVTDRYIPDEPAVVVDTTVLGLSVTESAEPISPAAVPVSFEPLGVFVARGCGANCRLGMPCVLFGVRCLAAGCLAFTSTLGTGDGPETASLGLCGGGDFLDLGECKALTVLLAAALRVGEKTPLRLLFCRSIGEPPQPPFSSVIVGAMSPHTSRARSGHWANAMDLEFPAFGITTALLLLKELVSIHGSGVLSRRLFETRISCKS
mmetsp:Transcript_8321/g.18621  ORF Transcript_8321/g.18621 Transcript_8321/m.18621 type:complete len:240 (+) Transcript_8321:474-1193(+)